MPRRNRANAERRHFGSGVDAPLPRLRALAFVLMAASWFLLWTMTSYWGPLFFTGTWLGATVLIYSTRPRHYPGIKRHLALSLLSVPLWWCFELVNSRVDNWEYLTASDYGAVSYALFASLAFSTVAPASTQRLGSRWGSSVSTPLRPLTIPAHSPRQRYWPARRLCP